MTNTKMRDQGRPVPGCNQCHRGIDAYTYGMGVVIKGNWLLQDPLVNGYSALEAYLPSQRIAISLVVTFAEGAFNKTTGSYPNEAVPISNRSARSSHPMMLHEQLRGIRFRPPAAEGLLSVVAARTRTGDREISPELRSLTRTRAKADWPTWPLPSVVPPSTPRRHGLAPRHDPRACAYARIGSSASRARRCGMALLARLQPQGHDVLGAGLSARTHRLARPFARARFAISVPSSVSPMRTNATLQPISESTACALSMAAVAAATMPIVPSHTSLRPSSVPPDRSHRPSAISRNAAMICARASRFSRTALGAATAHGPSRLKPRRITTPEVAGLADSP
jgi:hypothetical protein